MITCHSIIRFDYVAFDFGQVTDFNKIEKIRELVRSVGQPVSLVFPDTYDWVIDWEQRFRGLNIGRSSKVVIYGDFECGVIFGHFLITQNSNLGCRAGGTASIS